MVTQEAGTCIQCPDGSWVCGKRPQCPPKLVRMIAPMGRVEVDGFQFDVELWAHTAEDPPYLVRLVPA